MGLLGVRRVLYGGYITGSFNKGSTRGRSCGSIKVPVRFLYGLLAQTLNRDWPQQNFDHYPFLLWSPLEGTGRGLSEATSPSVLQNTVWKHKYNILHPVVYTMRIWGRMVTLSSSHASRDQGCESAFYVASSLHDSLCICFGPVPNPSPSTYSRSQKVGT